MGGLDYRCIITRLSHTRLDCPDSWLVVPYSLNDMGGINLPSRWILIWHTQKPPPYGRLVDDVRTLWRVFKDNLQNVSAPIIRPPAP